MDTSVVTNRIPVTVAPFYKRLAAWIYDSLAAIACFVLAFLLGYLLLYLLTLPWLNDFKVLSKLLSSHPLWAPLWTIFLICGVQFYYVYCWVKGGQTIGMKVWRLKLCHRNGKLLSWRKAYLRSLLSFAGIANLWSLLDKQRRGWHDIAVKSYLVVIPKNHRQSD